MRPIRLLLEGFLGFTTQGKQKIEVDFTGIGQARLVALAGPNGSGKSTVMDNMHPFRVMPSRWNKPTPAGGSYWDQVVLGDARKEFDFSHDGKTYRQILTFRSTAKTKRAEAYLMVQDEMGDWQPVATPQGVSSDGKTDTYDTVVESILGKPEVFFNTAFSAQSRPPLSEMDAGEVKTLLSAMLGADDLRAKSERASSVAKMLNAALVQVQAKARSVPDDRQRQVEASTAKDRAQTRFDEASRLVVERERGVERATEALSKAQVQASGEEALVTKRKLLSDEISRIGNDRDAQVAAAKNAAQSQIAALDEQIAKAKDDARKAEADKAQANSQIAQIRTFLAGEEKIRQAMEQVAAIDRELERLRARRAELEKAAQAAQHDSASLAQLANKMGSIMADGKAMGQRIEVVRKTSSVMEAVPCIGTDLQSQCPLLEQARKAKADLESMESHRVQLRNSYKDIAAQHSATHKRVEQGSEAVRQSTEAQKALDAETTKRQSAAALAAQAERIDRERQVLEQATARLADSESRLTEAKKSLDTFGLRKTDVLRESSRQIAELQARLQERFDKAQANLNALAQPQAVQAVEQAQRDVSTAKQGLEQAKADKERASTELAAAEKAVTLAQAALAESEKAAKHAEAISLEMSHWTLLSKALGNNGIVALVIDDAGPEISARCNALLESCYGGRFVVRIETQKTNGNGDLRETLEIWVEDAERDSHKPLSLLSGGERVWVNEALVRAMALHVAASSAARYATLFSDESDGALDTERKRQFMRMKHAVLEQGGFEREFFVSQTPELVEMADAVIDISAL
uniref:Putative ATPase involved in DNA repair n=1 Tax=mine drainage metagenome TaxID=410659 RepID=E6QMX3_9ZZZZ